MMTSSPRKSHSTRRHGMSAKLRLVLRKIAPQLTIDDLSSDVITRLSKYAHDLTRLEKKQIELREEFVNILKENKSNDPENETKEWIARHVIMNALTKDDAKINKLLCFSGLPVQFLFASNYLKETYENEENKNPLFFYEIIDDGASYPGDELLYYLIELLEEKDVNDLMICLSNLLDTKKYYYVALTAKILKRCNYPNQTWWKHLDEKISELSRMPNLERNEKMIDPTSLPILMKILDFLFGEGSKILEERRERRKIQGDSMEIAMPEDKKTKGSNAITTKDIALGEKIDKAAWLSVERSIQNKFSLLEIYAKNYYLAKEKYAKWTSTLVPSIVLHELEEAENQLISTIREIQEILGNAYGKKFELPYL